MDGFILRQATAAQQLIKTKRTSKVSVHQLQLMALAALFDLQLDMQQKDIAERRRAIWGKHKANLSF